MPHTQNTSIVAANFEMQHSIARDELTWMVDIPEVMGIAGDSIPPEEGFNFSEAFMNKCFQQCDEDCLNWTSVDENGNGSSTNQSEDPIFPPGFEPWRMPYPVQNAALSEEEHCGEGILLNNTTQEIEVMIDGTKSTLCNRRFTRSSIIREDNKEAQAVEIWAIGKKLGMTTDDEHAVIKELASTETSSQSDRPRKRGQPRKRKL